MNEEELDLENPKTPEEENPEEIKEPEKEPEEPIKSTKPEQSKELQSALAQKEHFRKKYEESQKELAKPNTPVDTLDGNPMEVVHLAKALEAYTEDEVEFITRNASKKSIQGIIDASKDDWVKTAIQAKREKVVKENQKLEPSTKQSPAEKDLDKVTAEDLRAMTVKQKEEFLIAKGWMTQRKFRGDK